MAELQKMEEYNFKSPVEQVVELKLGYSLDFQNLVIIFNGRAFSLSPDAAEKLIEGSEINLRKIAEERKNQVRRN